MSAEALDWADASVGLEVQRPWSTLLMSGQKTVETRGYALPAALIGRPIAIIETPEGSAGVSSLPDELSPADAPAARIVGTVVFASSLAYESRDAWLAAEKSHCVAAGSAYDWDGSRPLYGWAAEPSAVVRFDAPRAIPHLRRRYRSLFELLGEPGAGAETAARLEVSLAYKGRSETATLAPHETLSVCFDAASALFELPAESFSLKLILKGKALAAEAIASDVFADAFAAKRPPPKPKLMVVATGRVDAAAVAAARTDPAVPSFAAEHGSRRGKLPTSIGVRQGKM